MWHWGEWVPSDANRLETEFWASSQQPSPRLSSSLFSQGWREAAGAWSCGLLSFPPIPSEPRVTLLAWQSHMSTLGVFSDSSRFKVPLDTAGGSYEPLVIRFFNLLMEIRSPQRVREPEEPEYSLVSWSPKQTEPVDDIFALGVSVDKEYT